MIQVLIVDDESFVRNGLLKYINWEELNIDSTSAAETVDDALDFIQREKPQVIISDTDIRMPGMNGIGQSLISEDYIPKTRYIDVILEVILSEFQR